MTHRDGTTDLRAGHSLIEIAVVLVIIAALAPPVLGSAGRLHTSFSLRRAQEEAARLFADARWVAVGAGGRRWSSPPTRRAEWW